VARSRHHDRLSLDGAAAFPAAPFSQDGRRPPRPQSSSSPAPASPPCPGSPPYAAQRSVEGAPRRSIVVVQNVGLQSRQTPKQRRSSERSEAPKQPFAQQSFPISQSPRVHFGKGESETDFGKAEPADRPARHTGQHSRCGCLFEKSPNG
jgi:hypothetical protein